MYAIAIFFSYSLQFYIPMQILGPWFYRFFGECNEKMSDGILRISLTILTCKPLRSRTFTDITVTWLTVYKYYCFYFYCSCFSGMCAKTRSDNFIAWCGIFIVSRFDFSAYSWLPHIWVKWNRAILLEILEKHCHFDIWRCWLHFGCLHKHLGTNETRTTYSWTLNCATKCALSTKVELM